MWAGQGYGDTIGLFQYGVGAKKCRWTSGEMGAGAKMVGVKSSPEGGGKGEGWGS